MKTIKRFLLGALSSLLFSVGFAKTASHLDPMSLDPSIGSGESTAIGAADCVSICSIVERNR